MSETEQNLILAFETSCDETSVSVVKNGTEILSNMIATQVKSHQRFGGVVPEVASRHHVEIITMLITEALEKAGVTYQDLDAVAVTKGPGLVGALLIGISAAKAVAMAYNLPLIGTNHIAGHIKAANLVDKVEYPALALVVSGGHTELVSMKTPSDYEIIGDTRDDAAGESYDKVGRVMGINYPAGKTIDEMAHQGSETFDFPRAMMKEDNYDFSFSGLKSAFINTVHHADQVGETLDKNDLATSFQSAVVEVLVHKTVKAIAEYQPKTFILAGGVAANQGLRQALTEAINQQFPDLKVIIPPLRLCGDNAAMIGAAAYQQFLDQDFSDMSLNAEPGLEFPYEGE
ncbi:tRNA (adenosine(37)-N6)-threonylcarbamoyltransferase complex transferase subunit TsaD [Holzapfeliella floricola]|uniref:tRNA N6-adenosine threonylcarbamoyltransferase n=1 Tax=Holzapfeliella floricola DSM 23037 = JCM 16512 TaxID=1423744 RepID=A0A0R2DTF6_9LACO|nr:tRNA (adenosine(37)-N6)-threonylcarbamoyltransferase complex transferase subunit TsaD [Holzapfeliella floricola]KRN04215.1 DNA-binding iron metalloprotein AP endonuclease [Holzapfeliella floricola DSM 23037 = JCM 16512]